MSASTIRLNDGRDMPTLGLGTWKVSDDDARELVRGAIEAGYRAIDTASLYGNERGVGEGLRAACSPVWLTTKVWNDDQGYDETLRGARASLERLGVDAVDLYLIHWPMPKYERYVDTWRALIHLREKGKLRSIGVSNFLPEHIERLEQETGVLPSVNQVELHPAFQQRDLVEYHRSKGIVTQSWGPLGQGALLRDARIGEIADKHGCSPAQVIIAWHLAQGFSAIPKASNPDHMRANLEAARLTLNEGDMSAIRAMDDPDGRVGADPIAFDYGA